MSRELIGGPDGAMSTLIIDPAYVSCIDKPPSVELHQQLRDERDDVAKQRRLDLVRQDAAMRIDNDAVTTLLSRAAQLESCGQRTVPPSWFRRKYIRWSCKLKEIVNIIRE